jgi:polysaccharide biosynthesis/export protein
MRMRTIVVAVVFGFVGLTCGAAQLPTATSTRNLMIGPDDGVAIVVADAEELSKTWRVTSAGDLNLPMVGQVHAAGLTPAQLESELTEKLKNFLRDPHVTVYVAEFRSQPVTVEGGVAKPGTIQTEGPKTLLNVLMMAGGPNAAGPTVTVTRETKYGNIGLPSAKVDSRGQYSTAELKLRDVLNPSTPEANLLVQSHDTVSVSTKQRLVYVIGQVNRPGAVELDTQDSISAMQVLAAAGGLTSLASAGNTEIMHVDDGGRYSKVASINLTHVMNGKSEDRMLAPGDIIVVPQNRLKSYVEAATMSATTTGMYAILMHF